jgi:hypothetical protein
VPVYRRAGPFKTKRRVVFVGIEYDVERVLNRGIGLVSLTERSYVSNQRSYDRDLDIQKLYLQRVDQEQEESTRRYQDSVRKRPSRHYLG